MKIPKEYGGLGLSQYTYNRALMQFTQVHASLGALLSAHRSIGVPAGDARSAPRNRRTATCRAAPGAPSRPSCSPSPGSARRRPDQEHRGADRERGRVRPERPEAGTNNRIIAELVVVMAGYAGSGTGRHLGLRRRDELAGITVETAARSWGCAASRTRDPVLRRRHPKENLLG